jgi:hypothetical protein
MSADSELFSKLETHLMEDIHACISPDDLSLAAGTKVSDLPCDDRFARVVAGMAQLGGISKKYLGATPKTVVSKRERAANAVALFLEMNVHCKGTNERIPAGLTRATELVLAEAQQLLFEWLGGNCSSVPIGTVGCLGRVGPGSSRGVSDTDFLTKLANGPLTYSSTLVHVLYKRLVKSHSLWDETETIRFGLYGSGDKCVQPKITTVPKTSVIDRTIMVEPSLDMYFQLGTGAYLEGILRRNLKIDLSTQPDINREMARKGSTLRSDDGFRWCTIDLKSASDSISRALVERLMPAEWFKWLDSIRSRSVLLPDGTEIELEMMSTMGNGYTFPLQTLLFASLVASCYKLHGISLNYSGGNSYAVFGDDIIVDERIYQFVVDTLVDCGFVVNTAKSFASGPFRESCGTDWFLGRNVRPVYCSGLSTTQDRISLVNRLNRWSATWSIPLPRTMAVLLSSIRVKERYLVPNYESDVAGIHVGLDLALKARRVGFRVHSGSQLSTRLGAGSDSLVYRLFTTSPRKRAVWRVRRSGENGGIVYEETSSAANAAGLMLAVLHGSLRGRHISLRSERVWYTDGYGISPGWGDPSSFGGASAHWAGSYAHWEACTDYNLCDLL